jgi:outer membrane lipoprotein SlyB
VQFGVNSDRRKKEKNVKIADLEPFKAEIVALGGLAAATVGMLTDHQLLAIITSVPGGVAMYGSYVKGKVTAEDVAKAIAKETNG